MKRRCKETILSNSLRKYVELQCPHDAVTGSDYCKKHIEAEEAMSELSNPMANHNHQPPNCPYCESTDAWICNRCGTHYDGMQGQCVHCPPEPTYTLAQVQEMKNAWVEEVVGRVENMERFDFSSDEDAGVSSIMPEPEGDYLFRRAVLATIKEMKE